MSWQQLQTLPDEELLAPWAKGQEIAIAGLDALDGLEEDGWQAEDRALDLHDAISELSNVLADPARMF